jgi:hypothetical protein
VRRESGVFGARTRVGREKKREEEMGERLELSFSGLVYEIIKKNLRCSTTALISVEAIICLVNLRSQ